MDELDDTEVIVIDDTEVIVIDDVVENTESISTKSQHVQSSLDMFVGTTSKEKEGEIDVYLEKRV